MPQMGPLPWVMILLVVLGLILGLMMMIYFWMSFSVLNDKIKKSEMNLNWSW